MSALPPSAVSVALPGCGKPAGDWPVEVMVSAPPTETVRPAEAVRVASWPAVSERLPPKLNPPRLPGAATASVAAEAMVSLSKTMPAAVVVCVAPPIVTVPLWPLASTVTLPPRPSLATSLPAESTTTTPSSVALAAAL